MNIVTFLQAPRCRVRLAICLYKDSTFTEIIIIVLINYVCYSFSDNISVIDTKFTIEGRGNLAVVGNCCAAFFQLDTYKDNTFLFVEGLLAAAKPCKHYLATVVIMMYFKLFIMPPERFLVKAEEEKEEE